MMSDGISAGALQPDADELLFDDWLGAGLDKAIAAVWTAFRFRQARRWKYSSSGAQVPPFDVIIPQVRFDAWFPRPAAPDARGS